MGGRPSDPRMTRAVQARQADPELSLRDALVRGGFVFDLVDETGEIVDTDNISLVQRKNQLSRRMRLIKTKTEGKMPRGALPRVELPTRVELPREVPREIPAKKLPFKKRRVVQVEPRAHEMESQAEKKPRQEAPERLSEYNTMRPFYPPADPRAFYPTGSQVGVSMANFATTAHNGLRRDEAEHGLIGTSAARASIVSRGVRNPSVTEPAAHQYLAHQLGPIPLWLRMLNEETSLTRQYQKDSDYM